MNVTILKAQKTSNGQASVQVQYSDGVNPTVIETITAIPDLNLFKKRLQARADEITASYNFVDTLPTGVIDLNITLTPEEEKAQEQQQAKGAIFQAKGELEAGIITQEDYQIKIDEYNAVK